MQAVFYIQESRPAMQGGFEHFLSALQPTPV